MRKLLYVYSLIYGPIYETIVSHMFRIGGEQQQKMYIQFIANSIYILRGEIRTKQIYERMSKRKKTEMERERKRSVGEKK